MSDVNINPNSPNTVTIQNADKIITVTDNSKHTEVNLTQEITDIVNVVTQGPQGTQGIQGPAGQGFDEPFTGSLIVSGSFEIIGDQTISGSLIISGSSTFTNIGPAIFSGSVSSTQGFTGSLFGTASNATLATTASHALFAVSASHEVVKEVSSSHANTADVADGLQNQPSIFVTNITASGGISSSNGIITAITGSFNHIITDDDTIEFRNRNTGARTGRLKFDASTGLNVQNAAGARTKIRAGRGEFLSLEAGPVGFNSLGSITASGDISSSTNIIANSFIGTFSGGLSGSSQIASDISGAFGAASSSFSTRVTTNESAINTLNTSGLLSSSAQIASDISGAFTAASASFSTRITANEVVTSKTLISSSAQIASDISGAFSSTSSSLASRTSTLENKTIYSGSFSGSFEGNGSGLTSIPASGIVGLNLSRISSGSATASISPNLGLVVNTNVSSSATSTASFGTYLGDGSQLLGISTTPFPFTGDAQITGSLTVSGSTTSNIILPNAPTDAFIISGSNDRTRLHIYDSVENSTPAYTEGAGILLTGGDGAAEARLELSAVGSGNGGGNNEQSYIHSNQQITITGADNDAGHHVRLVGSFGGLFLTSNTSNTIMHLSSNGGGTPAGIRLGQTSVAYTHIKSTGNAAYVKIGKNDSEDWQDITNDRTIFSGNISGSTTSTASFGTYVGDGSQLSGISSGGATEEFVWFIA